MSENPTDSHIISNVTLPNKPPNTTWNVHILDEHVHSITPHTPSPFPSNNHSYSDHSGALLTPSLCNPHIHLDKAFLLSTYPDLRIQQGTFAEAMTLTSQAKQRFTMSDLLSRGRRVLHESIRAGVTHMRAFVEVDASVERLCLDAGVQLQREARGKCEVQLCAFAQEALFSPSQGDEDGLAIRGLMEFAAEQPEVGCVGSAPYVEADEEREARNVAWMVELSARKGKNLDFHLDYSIEREREARVWGAVQQLREKDWEKKNEGKTVVLGHCTRLTRFGDEEWSHLREAVGALPLAFVGLPTSDLFMMRSADGARGTLDVPRLVRELGFDACLGVNNVGNAFTPHGSCDPLTLAGMGVGIYQAGTERDAEVLFECVSTRARSAVGLGGGRKTLDVDVGDRADFVLFGGAGVGRYDTRKSVSEAVYLYDSVRGRTTFFGGKDVSGGLDEAELDGA